MKYYKGEMLDRNQNRKEGTKIIELVRMSNSMSDFCENDIINRNDQIIEGFIKFLDANGLTN